MGREPGWAAVVTGRPPMRSPGRPPVARKEHRRLFWTAVSRGVTSTDAGLEAGVSQVVGSRWFRECGGVTPQSVFHVDSGRYLSFAEREQIALWRAENMGVRQIARELNRSPSTVSRELRRNASTRGGTLMYRATVAQWHRDRRATRPKQAKMVGNPRLRRYVQERLAGRLVTEHGVTVAGPAVPFTGRNRARRADRRWGQAWSPEQISARLRHEFPDDPTMRISHEAIYQALYLEGRGAAGERWPASTSRACGPGGRCGYRVRGLVAPDAISAASSPPRSPSTAAPPRSPIALRPVIGRAISSSG